MPTVLGFILAWDQDLKVQEVRGRDERGRHDGAGAVWGAGPWSFASPILANPRGRLNRWPVCQYGLLQAVDFGCSAGGGHLSSGRPEPRCGSNMDRWLTQGRHSRFPLAPTLGCGRNAVGVGRGELGWRIELFRCWKTGTMGRNEFRAPEEEDGDDGAE